MKKILSLIAALIFIGACDDGDMSFKTFDFSSETLTPCTVEGLTYDTYYKITGTEGLILELTPGILLQKSTLDPLTGKDVPQEIILNNSAKLTYYNYVSAPESGLCTVSEIPKATETWTGTGTLSVVTRPNIKDNLLKGYFHTITMKNISFKKGDETITINNSVLGDITTTFTFTFNFNEAAPATEPLVKSCTGSTTSVYTVKADELLMLSVPSLAAIFPAEEGEQTLPITTLTNGNRIVYTIYDGTVLEGNICPPVDGPPLSPNPEDRWQATAGSIIIKTTPDVGNQFKHKIYLKDVVFTNVTTTTLTFNLKDVAVTDTDGNYLFGTWTTIQ